MSINVRALFEMQTILIFKTALICEMKVRVTAKWYLLDLSGVIWGCSSMGCRVCFISIYDCALKLHLQTDKMAKLFFVEKYDKELNDIYK